MNVIMIVPTGLGAEIGGHAGDANPAAKLLAKCCNKLIVHPNVVNASDINEMPENCLYVEGSILNRFLRGEIFLKEVHYNKILLVANSPIECDTYNSANAARTTIGSDVKVMELETPLIMNGYYDENGKATGDVIGWRELVQQVIDKDFDVLAIQSQINVDDETKQTYLNKGGVNPWGGVEAKLSKVVSIALNKPACHAPFVSDDDILCDYEEIPDPRMSAEMVSVSYLHCVLKGLHKAPRIDYKNGLSNKDIDFLVTPINVVGEPHEACIANGIKVIAVRENKTVLNDPMPEDFIIVDNYIEAAGLIMTFRAGVDSRSVRRPIANLDIELKEEIKN
jgi:hypothetical protein